MLQRTGSKFRSKGFSRLMFIYAVVLIAFFGISAAASAFQITVFNIQNRKEITTVDVQTDDTISIIIKKIEEKTGISRYNQKLLKGDGTRMYNEKIVADYGIQEGDIVFLIVSESSPSPSHSDPDHILQFFRLCDECMLPATGFSSQRPAALSEQPKDLRYTDVAMRLMIPSLDVDSELVSIPMDGDSWAVEWLGDRAGILAGSVLPGEGFSIVAAHNTLNNTEYGPFALLGTLELNELIAVSGSGNGIRTFRVFANELLAPDDMEKMASIAEREENTLVLVTCENESADGGYLNRRAVFVKPVF